jgi:hypothetical protein
MNNPTTAMMNPILVNIRIFKPNLAQNMFLTVQDLKLVSIMLEIPFAKIRNVPFQNTLINIQPLLQAILR